MTVTILAMTMTIKYQKHNDIKVMIKIMTAKNHDFRDNDNLSHNHGQVSLKLNIRAWIP